jgi:hypothetical protein
MYRGKQIRKHRKLTEPLIAIAAAARSVNT